jgi:hypothetical protein
MLARACDVSELTAEKLLSKSKQVFVQPKLDGLRCIADLQTG